jgi:hypothetical protein
MVAPGLNITDAPYESGKVTKADEPRQSLELHGIDATGAAPRLSLMIQRTAQFTFARGMSCGSYRTEEVNFIWPYLLTKLPTQGLPESML